MYRNKGLIHPKVAHKLSRYILAGGEQVRLTAVCKYNERKTINTWLSVWLYERNLRRFINDNWMEHDWFMSIILAWEEHCTSKDIIVVHSGLLHVVVLLVVVTQYKNRIYTVRWSRVVCADHEDLVSIYHLALCLSHSITVWIIAFCSFLSVLDKTTQQARCSNVSIGSDRFLCRYR